MTQIIIGEVDRAATSASWYEDGEFYESFTVHNSAMTFKERAKSAFLQLMERIPEPKPWNGRVVCVESTCPGIYTAGKIYECRDGRLISNLGTMYPNYGYYTSLKDLQARNITKFIELKED